MALLMTPATEGTTAPPEGSSATPFESDVASMFGDFATNSGESPEPDSTSAAGTTPAEPATETATTPEDAVDADGAATPETPSDGSTPAAATEPVVEDDPLLSTSPATYVVNGQTRTSDDIRVFKEGGAVITAESLPNVLSKLAEREQLADRVRARDTDYQTLSKATEWTDQAGKTISGPEAAIEMRIGNASLFAENKLLVDALMDPDTLFGLLATEQVPDGKGGLKERVVINTAALAQLQRENTLQQREIAAQIRDHFKTALAQVSRTAPSIDFVTEAPRLIALVASDSKLDASLLTPADRQLLAEHLPDHVQNGQASVKWQKLAKTMMQDRASQKASQRSVVDATTKATKDGLNRMAAAARGVKPAPKPVAVAAPKPPSPKEERMADEGQLFDAMLSSGAAAMRQAR